MAVKRATLVDKNTGKLELQERYPHGHPAFVPMSLEEMRLHSEKNHDYAAGGDPLGNFKRVASIMSLYPGFPIDKPEGVAMAFLMKQLDAVMWGMSKGIKHKVEGYKGRLQDISVYSKITSIIMEEKQSDEN